MRDVPQLKVVREDQGWSQRDLAARSGVAQNTISQLERGERKAMPSTVRKLADALEVVPQVLLAKSQREKDLARGAQARSKLPPEVREKYDQEAREVDLQIKRERKEQVRAAEKRQAERRVLGIEEEPREQDEVARWAERYVSGPIEVGDSVPEKHVASIRSIWEELYLQHHTVYETVPSLLLYSADLNVARSWLVTNDPQDAVRAAQLVLRRAKRIVEEYDRHLQSFHRIPDHYYEDPAARSRIQKLQEALSERRVEAAEAVQELVDLYDECLDTLEDQIIGMREEGKVIAKFVT
jgi:transcriptional regulator with XRE-family HTH domain